MSVMQQITTLENSLGRLTREWERYFAGDLKVPPVKERAQLQRQLRVLAERPGVRRTEQYRLEQLQHRFMTYHQMWERMLREREEGRSPFPIRRPGAPPPPPPQPAPRAKASAPNATASPSVKTPEADLYQRYVAARQQAGETARVDPRTFRAQIEKQREKLESRFGQKVRFDVVVEGGKVKLAARKATGKT